MDLTVKELSERFKRGEKPLVIDVRDKSERDTGSIPNTIHIPLAELPAMALKLDPEAETILHCQSGIRSAQAMKYLQSKGFTNVKNLKGGIGAWNTEN